MVMLKALGLPQQEPRHKITPQAPEPTAPEAEALLGQLAREQEANRDILEELQAAIANLEDKLSKKEEAKQAEAKTEEIKKETIVLAVLGSGTFGSGQVEIDEIDEKLRSMVNELVREISAFPDHRLVIEGHTDNLPIRSSSAKWYRDNMDLSYLRAKAVANLLVSSGISIERISVIGYGDTHPIASNETVAGRSKNRRVEVKLIPPDRES
jgi:outer membrane protein OmpA-like peptidoglycan-associated protein